MNLDTLFDNYLNFFTTPGQQLEHYLLVAGILFTLGIVSCITRSNAIGILIGIELILNSAILNFVAFWHFLPQGGDASPAGPLSAIFIVVIATCELVVALAVLLSVNSKFATIETHKIHKLNG